MPPLVRHGRCRPPLQTLADALYSERSTVDATRSPQWLTPFTTSAAWRRHGVHTSSASSLSASSSAFTFARCFLATLMHPSEPRLNAMRGANTNPESEERRSDTPASVPPSQPQRKRRRSFQHRREGQSGNPPDSEASPTSSGGHKAASPGQAASQPRRRQRAGEDEIRTEFTSRGSDAQRQPHRQRVPQAPPPGAAVKHHPASQRHNHSLQHQQQHQRHHRYHKAGRTEETAKTQFPSPKHGASPRRQAPIPKNPLAHLLRTHAASRQNFNALSSDPRVVDAFCQVALEVVRELTAALLDAGYAETDGVRDVLDTTSSSCPSQLHIFFNSFASMPSSSQQQQQQQQTSLSVDLPSTTHAEPNESFIAPLRVPPLPASAFVDLLNAVDRKDDKHQIGHHTQHIIETFFVAPLTRHTTRTRNASAESDSRGAYRWRFQEALELHLLTPSSLHSSSDDGVEGAIVKVEASLSSPAAREAWITQRAHDLIELADTVAFFKWIKDEEMLKRMGSEKGHEDNTETSVPTETETQRTRFLATELAELREAYDALAAVDATATRQSLAGTLTSAQRVELAKRRLKASQRVLERAQSIRNLVPKLDEAHDDVATTQDETERASAASMHVLDVLLMLLLRAVLPLWPTARLSTTDRATLFRMGTFPWFASTREDEVCVPLARWLVYVELTRVLGTTKTDSHHGSAVAVASAPLEGELPCVQLLRLLCWPTPLDVQSTIVERALSGTASKPARQGTTQQQQQQKDHQRIPNMKDLLAVLNSTEARQRTAYDLLYVLFYAQAASSPTASHLPERVTIPPHLLRGNALYLRTVSALCVYVMDADRFMSERFTQLPSPNAVLPSSSLSSASLSDAASALPACWQADVAAQSYVAGGLTRHVFLAFTGPDLAALWVAMARKRAAWVWEAYVRAVGPLSLTLLLKRAEQQGSVETGSRTAGQSVHSDEAARDAVWTCLMPLRSQLLGAPALQKALAELLLDSLEDSAARARACAEEMDSDTHTSTTSATTTTVTTTTAGRQNGTDNDKDSPYASRASDEKEAVGTAVSTTHLLHLMSIAALLLEVERTTLSSSPTSHSQAESVLSRELPARFTSCLHAYLRQPIALPSSSTTNAVMGVAASSSSSPHATERDAEQALMTLIGMLDRLQQSGPPAEACDPIPDARSAHTRPTVTDQLATLTAAHLLTPAARSDIRLWHWQREQAARCRECETPVDVSHPILRQWHERLWESEVTGLHTAFPINAARVYHALVPILLLRDSQKTDASPNSDTCAHDETNDKGVTLPTLSPDEIRVIFDVLVHLHTRAGLQLMRPGGRPYQHHHSSNSNSSGRKSQENVFDLMVQAVKNESAQNTSNAASRGMAKAALVEENVDTMEQVLARLLARAATAPDKVHADSGVTRDAKASQETMRCVPLALWLNAVVLGLVPLVDLQPGEWPTPSSLPASDHNTGHTEFADTLIFSDPRTFLRPSTAPTAVSAAAGEEAAVTSAKDVRACTAEVPSMSTWLTAFREEFRARRTVRLVCGLVLMRNMVFLHPNDGGWHRLALSETTSETVNCANLLPSLLAVTRTDAEVETEPGTDSSRRATQQLLRFLQHALLESEIAEAVPLTSSDTRAPFHTGSEETVTPGFVPNTCGFSEEDGVKEACRCYARVHTITSLLVSLPHTTSDSAACEGAASAATVRVLYLLLLKALGDLWRVQSANASQPASPHTLRLTSDALLCLAVATQRVRCTGVFLTATPTSETTTATATHTPDTSESASGDRSVNAGPHTPRLPPTSPTRWWATTVLTGSASRDTSEAGHDAISPAARCRQRLSRALAPDATDTRAARPLGDWFTNAVSTIDAQAVLDMAQIEAAHWLPHALEGLSSVHLSGAGATLSARHVVSVVVATTALRDTQIVPSSVSCEVLSKCAAVLQRVAEDRRTASRDANLILTAVLVAPEMSASVVPVAHHLREARDQLSLVEIVRAFRAIALATHTFDAQHDLEAERQASEAAETPLILMTDAASASTVSAAIPAVEFHAQESRSGDTTSPTTSTTTTGAATRGVCCRLASLPSGRGQPPALRGAWLALSRRLLSRELAWVSEQDEEHATHSSDERRALLADAWSHALSSGAALGCADSAVFGQLVATLVFADCGDLSTGNSPPETLCRDLTLQGWARVVRACSQTPDIHRDELAELLREPVLAFVQTFAQPSSSFLSSASSHTRSLDWRDMCVFVEALPSLFVESASFWDAVHHMTERAVSRCVHESGSAGSDGVVNSVDVASECDRSFSWAAQTAGHLSP